MLSYVRQKLRMIRYYSAPRRRTLLTRFVDAGLIAAIVLAFPAAWLADAEVEDEAVLIRRSGHLSRVDGGVAARVLDPDAPAPPRSDVPYGEFHLTLIEQRRGWPVSSTVIQPHVELDLNLYDQPGMQRNADLDPNAPERLAILEALQRGRAAEMGRSQIDPDEAEAIAAAYDDLIRRWGEGGVRVERRVLGWTFNTAACWVILSFAFSAIAAVLWVMAMILLHNRETLKDQRRREGLCVNCGYDLYGLDFNERCPECGTIIH